MRANPEAWSKDSFFCVHNWWHLALYHLDLGEVDAWRCSTGRSMATVRRSSSTWSTPRRCCGGSFCAGLTWAIQVGHHHRITWEPVQPNSQFCFNDAHAMMAFSGGRAGRKASETVLNWPGGSDGQRDGDNAFFTREVGHPVGRVIKAFGDGNHAEAVAAVQADPQHCSPAGRTAIRSAMSSI